MTSLSGSFDCNVLTVALEVAGTQVASDQQITSIEIWSALNRICRSRVCIQDESSSGKSFGISSSAVYVPGAKIKIQLGYSGTPTTVFAGVIVSHAIEVGAGMGPSLWIEAADPAIAMTLARHSALYSDLTDSQLIEKLLAAYQLQGTVTATTATHPVIVQQASSDWDLMVMRADVNGMVVACEQETISIAKPNTTAQPSLTLALGQSILEARLRLDASSQLPASAITSIAWDPANLAISKNNDATADVSEFGNLSSTDLAGVFGCKLASQQTAAALTADELSTWSQATLQRQRLAKVRGVVKCQGTPDPRLGSTVQLSGLGDRFTGTAYVTAVAHRVRAGQWTTELDIGLSPEPFAASADQISPPPAAGQLPAAGLIQIGLVTKISDDPDNQYRLQIQLPLVQEDQNLIWARMSHPYASADCGFQFLPEVGDEVLVAFMDGDPRFPVVLGSLYSKKHAPAQAPTAENKLKSLVTKSKLRLDFDEEAKSILLTTPASQKVFIDDKSKSIQLLDSQGNSIKLSDAGIELSAKGDINLTATGSIQLSAQANLSGKGGAKLALAAPQVELNSDGQLMLKAGAEAKLTASGMVAIQGGLVKIN